MEGVVTQYRQYSIHRLLLYKAKQFWFETSHISRNVSAISINLHCATGNIHVIQYTAVTQPCYRMTYGCIIPGQLFLVSLGYVRKKEEKNITG
jgi:hypothetical protein